MSMIATKLQKVGMSVKQKAALVSAAITIIGFDAMAFAVQDGAAAAGELKQMIQRAVNLVFGVVAFGGIINIVRGAVMISKGVQDDGGGQDAAAISKGRGALIAGVLMVIPQGVFYLITQKSAGEYLSAFFS